MANFNINKTILGGRLIADPELKQTTSGVSVCSFTLAVNRKPIKGREQQADFINCVAWRQTGEFISRYFKKGSSLCIVGNIQVRDWQDQNGQKRYATEVIVDEALFVDGKNDNAEISVATEAEPHFEEYSEDDDCPF
ncbi:MAG: single-stranded DNA-binding protein [Clostridia bacterium]|nr:single-stranded DNA-binding protein [Clostridia bacterium]